jgi:prepilin-type N-terminal cleavage/methylation domain-containing protein
MKRMQKLAGRWEPGAFTLIELLVVITILAVLMALLTPAVTRTLGSGKAAACGSNLKQIAMAMISFDGDNGHLPWAPEGHTEAQYDASGSITGSKGYTTNWNDKLRLFKYLPSEYMKGVWRCPVVSYKEMIAKDKNDNPANWGGYGICSSIFRAENSYNGSSGQNTPNRPLCLSRIQRPSNTWLVGDCGQPFPVDNPDSDRRYYRATSGYGRPSSIGKWDFTTPVPSTPSSPALRHNQKACWAGFDSHVNQLDWPGMLDETNNFTARSETL